MVSGKHKSHTLRKVFVKTPGGRTTVQYKRRKPQHTRCSCGTKLLGVPRDIPGRIKKLSKSEKKPSRPYGGNLCSSCMRKQIKAKIEASL